MTGVKHTATKKVRKKREPAKKKVCTSCGKEKTLGAGFYISKSPLHAVDGRVPICKACIGKESLSEDGQIDENKFKNILRQIDKPYYKDTLQSAINQLKKENGYISDEDIKYQGERILGLYFTKLNSLRQLRNKTYTDSEKDNFIQKNSTVLTKSNSKTTQTDKIINNKHEKRKPNDFVITDEIIDMFGEGYSPSEYKKMYKKYKDMCETYVVQTSIHKEALITYCRFKIKEEEATANGLVTDAQKWYSAAQQAAESAKLTPKQISKEDLQGGIVNFSDIFKTVEGAKERIKIFPEFKYQPKDSADFIIWCYINYERNLNNMPEVTYSDIYKFYDEKKKEYVDNYGDPYGIFTEDTTESNRENIEKFITIPPEFRDNE